MNAPWLVQRAKFTGADSGSIDDVLRFDYMGSADVSVYRYKVIFKPTSIIPDIDIE